MNTFRAILAVVALALSAGAFAQETDAAASRQQRMDAAYERAHGTHVADSGVRADARKAGHAIHEGVKSAGHAVQKGLKATGHAVRTGVQATGRVVHHVVRATGHALHEGVDKISRK